MYSFNPNAPLAQEFLRILTSRLDDSLVLVETLPDSPIENVHNLRKNIKRIRALLRLARPSFREELFIAENQAFRDIGRLLSDIRDKAVLRDTFNEIFLSDAGALEPVDPSLLALSQRLDGVAAAAYEGLRDDAQFRETLARRFSARKAAWENAAFSLDREMLVDGLARTYRAGRRRFIDVYLAKPTAEAFHEWRKQVKYLWHHHELLSLVFADSKAFETSTYSLDHLAGLLGKAHDAAELADWLSANLAANAPRDLHRDVVFVRIDFEGAARPHGSAIFRQKPSEKLAELGGTVK